jgi:hypothetical protein
MKHPLPFLVALATIAGITVPALALPPPPFIRNLGRAGPDHVPADQR